MSSDRGGNTGGYVGFTPAGTGHAVVAGCVQCQGKAGQGKVHGKAKTGALRGMKGWLCARCVSANAAAAQAKAA